MGRAAGRWRFRRLCSATALILAVVSLFAFSAEIALVPTTSMEGTILPGDHVLVDKLLYGPHLPFTHYRLPAVKPVRRGEVISIRSPRQPEIVLIKRAIALAGDRVEIRAGVVYVNSIPLAEPYANYRAREHSSMAETAVPPGQVFVLGDNRDNSEDSRAFGAVPAENIIGVPVVVCWSFAKSWSEWLDASGNIRPRAYWSLLYEFPAKTRWSRSGKLL